MRSTNSSTTLVGRANCQFHFFVPELEWRHRGHNGRRAICLIATTQVSQHRNFSQEWARRAHSRVVCRGAGERRGGEAVCLQHLRFWQSKAYPQQRPRACGPLRRTREAAWRMGRSTGGGRYWRGSGTWHEAAEQEIYAVEAATGFLFVFLAQQTSCVLDSPCVNGLAQSYSCQFHTARIHRMQKAHAMAQKWLCHLVAATAATAAASAATGGGGRFCGSSIAGAVCGCEDGKLNAGLLAGALGAGDFLLLIDDNLLKAGFALFANVFIDGHGRSE